MPVSHALVDVVMILTAPQCVGPTHEHCMLVFGSLGCHFPWRCPCLPSPCGQ